MEAKIQTIHFDAKEQLLQFVEKKVDKLLRRYEKAKDIDVTLKLLKPEAQNNKECAMRFAVPPTGDVFASKTADTFEEAVDLCLEAIERQLEKTKK